MKELRESSIFVYQRINDPIRYIRCVEDGNLLLESKGTIAYIVVGVGMPTKIIKITPDVYIRIKCKRCDTYYSILIQTI